MPPLRPAKTFGLSVSEVGFQGLKKGPGSGLCSLGAEYGAQRLVRICSNVEYTHKYVCVCICACVYIYIFSKFICMYFTRAQAPYTDIHMCTRIYIYIHLHMCIYTYTSKHMHVQEEASK